MSFVCVTLVCESTVTVSSNIFNYGLSVSSPVPTVYWSSVAVVGRFIASLDVKFLCFITLSTSFSHFKSGRPRRLSPSGQVVIPLGHLLGRAHIETQATQPTQGRAAQVSVIHKSEYVSAS